MNKTKKKPTYLSNPKTIMKRILSLVTLGGLFAAATASAQVDLYVTGSTAFRANAYRSIRAMYGANLTGQNPADSSATSGSNIVTWAGTIPSLFGGQTVTVRASYNGSAAGVQAIAANTTQTYYSSATAGDTTTTTHGADVAFSDVFQSSTLYTSPTLIDTNVGVQPFAWVKSVTAGLGSFTNVTIQQLQAFLSGGTMPLSLFTGLGSDTAIVHLVGRDTGSGTRITSELDALYVGTPTEWAPDGSCNWNIFGGFSSGSGIVPILNGSCGAAIAYLGIADAKNVNSGLNILSYDGAKPFLGLITTPDYTPIRRGQCSSWSYEHLMRRSGAGANIVAFYARLTSEINTDLATSTTAIQVGTMQVSRLADGGPIAP